LNRRSPECWGGGGGEEEEEEDREKGMI